MGKTGLLDHQTIVLDRLRRPLHDLRLSVIDRCNLRCPYCMPQEDQGHQYQFLDPAQWLTFSEIEEIVRVFVELGGLKLRITGGEPLLRPMLPELVARLKKIDGLREIALTTNGILLAPMAKVLKDAGLDRLTISLDSLDDKVYHRMSGGRAQLETVLDGMNQAQAAGFESFKINCVVQRGVNDHTVLDMVKHFRGTPHILRFIEYMDVGNQNHWDYAKVVPSDELVKMIGREFPLRALQKNYTGETSTRYGFLDTAGEIGFVSSVTKAFCGDCNRLRLSADGKMYTCLFSAQGVDIRQPLREKSHDLDIARLIAATWNSRADRYSQLRSSLASAGMKARKVEMYQIGG